MNIHDTAITFYELGSLFKQIKDISGSGEIDRLCVEGFSKAKNACDSLQPNIIDEMKKKHADPMV